MECSWNASHSLLSGINSASILVLENQSLTTLRKIMLMTLISVSAVGKKHFINGLNRTTRRTNLVFPPGEPSSRLYQWWTNVFLRSWLLSIKSQVCVSYLIAVGYSPMYTYTLCIHFNWQFKIPHLEAMYYTCKLHNGTLCNTMSLNYPFFLFRCVYKLIHDNKT